MDESIRRITELSTKQHGLIARPQLLSNGRTPRQIDHALATGRLVRVHQGVYRVAGAALTDDGMVAAGLMFTDGVASHRSAASLLELADVSASAPEITIRPTRSYRNSGLILHRSSD